MRAPYTTLNRSGEACVPSAGTPAAFVPSVRGLGGPSGDRRRSVAVVVVVVSGGGASASTTTIARSGRAPWLPLRSRADDDEVEEGSSSSSSSSSARTESAAEAWSRLEREENEEEEREGSSSSSGSRGGDDRGKRKKKFVVVGGGWGGWGAAKALCQSGVDADITLIDALPDPTGVSSSSVPSFVASAVVRCSFLSILSFCLYISLSPPLSNGPSFKKKRVLKFASLPSISPPNRRATTKLTH